MAALKPLLLVPALFWAAPVEAQSVASWRGFVAEASVRFGVPAAWIERVMQAESGGRTHFNGRPIRSSAGAIGLMQLMPATWADMRARLGLGHDPDQPRDNIMAGTFYLRLMHDRFGYPGMFAAYNAGPARYAEHLAGRRSLPGETVRYLASVAPRSSTHPVITIERATTAGGLFAVRRDVGAAPRSGSALPPPDSLFVALSQAR
jgi:soluble lytic murein transglycosylase-like protein